MTKMPRSPLCQLVLFSPFPPHSEPKRSISASETATITAPSSFPAQRSTSISSTARPWVGGRSRHTGCKSRELPSCEVPRGSSPTKLRRAARLGTGEGRQKGDECPGGGGGRQQVGSGGSLPARLRDRSRPGSERENHSPCLRGDFAADAADRGEAPRLAGLLLPHTAWQSRPSGLASEAGRGGGGGGGGSPPPSRLSLHATASTEGGHHPPACLRHARSPLVPGKGGANAQFARAPLSRAAPEDSGSGGVLACNEPSSSSSSSAGWLALPGRCLPDARGNGRLKVPPARRGRVESGHAGGGGDSPPSDGGCASPRPNEASSARLRDEKPHRIVCRGFLGGERTTQGGGACASLGRAWWRRRRPRRWSFRWR